MTLHPPDGPRETCRVIHGRPRRQKASFQKVCESPTDQMSAACTGFTKAVADFGT